MPEAIRITNSECPNLGEYDEAAQAAEDQFKASKNTADIDDTLTIECPQADCDLAFELYIDEGRLERVVRHGLFGKVCVQQAMRNT